MRPGWMLLWLIAAMLPARAQSDLGTVSGKATDMPGAFVCKFPSGFTVRVRDVVSLQRGSTQLGEALVVKVDGTRAEILPKPSMKSTPQIGDVVRVARHAEEPRDFPHAAVPLPNPAASTNGAVSPTAQGAPAQGGADAPFAVLVGQAGMLDEGNQNIVLRNVPVYLAEFNAAIGHEVKSGRTDVNGNFSFGLLRPDSTYYVVLPYVYQYKKWVNQTDPNSGITTRVEKTYHIDISWHQRLTIAAPGAYSIDLSPHNADSRFCESVEPDYRSREPYQYSSPASLQKRQ